MWKSGARASCPQCAPAFQAVLVLLVLLVACSDDAPAPEATADVVEGDTDASPGSDADADADTDAVEFDPQQAILDVPMGDEGVFELDILDAPVHVVYTELGVPHIYAESRADLYRVEGFLLARDRYFEVEVARRLALGELSELLGDLTLATDHDSRTRGMTHVADRLFALLDDESREIVQAYADGMNAYIDAVADGLLPAPQELVVAAPLLGAANALELMEPIDLRGMVGFAGTVVYQMGYEAVDVTRGTVARTLEGRFGEDDAFGELRQAGLLDDLFNRIAPMRDAASTPGFGTNGALEKDAPGWRRNPSPRRQLAAGAMPPLDMLQRAVGRNDAFAQRLRPGNSRAFGSNVWAVGERGTGGGSLLAGDGHLPLSVPTLFYQLGLDTAVFGDGDITQLGLVFAGFPLMAVGTNGHVAFSQTYSHTDVTDWYTEEIQLDDSGLPIASRFAGEWRDLVEIAEQYEVSGIVLLGTVDRTEVLNRYTTFDGRLINAIEGVVVDDPETVELEVGQSLVNIGGEWIIPGDTDGDEVVSAISFDFTGLDVNNIMRSLLAWGRATSVEEMRAAHGNLVSYAQNIGAADSSGGTYYSGFNATPCRTHLDRDDQGEWVEGADPLQLIDGTRFGAFEIPVDENGDVDWEAGAVDGDPANCIVPFEVWPQALSPEAGYIQNANQEFAPITGDDSYTNDPYYIGSYFSEGYRAHGIQTTLERLVADQEATIETMAALQADVNLYWAEDLAPALMGAVELARDVADRGEASPAEERLLALYQSEQEAIDEVYDRLDPWLEAGAPARSGVETFYHSPDQTDRDYAVATAIFSQWFRDFLHGVLDDEEIWDAIEIQDDPLPEIMRLVVPMVTGRGDDNPESLSAWSEETGESVFFDILGTDEVESSHEIALMALIATLEYLEMEGRSVGEGGYGTDDMDQWLWGLRHLVRFPSLLDAFAGDLSADLSLLTEDFRITPQVLRLAANMEEDDPRRGLRWFPQDGGFMTIDSAEPLHFQRNYWYDYGPVMRMVIRLEDGRVSGQNIIPGGQSGLPSSPHFADQAALWLGNEAIPMRFHVEDVVEGAERREEYQP